MNKRVDRILAVIFKCVSNLKEEYKFDHEENNKLAQKIAEKSIILLKNSQIKKSKDILFQEFLIKKQC